MSTLAVKMRAISKTFDSVAANQDVDLDIRLNSIHAIVGENGAGKSTIMKILYGMYSADQGTIEVFGKQERIDNSLTAIKLGIGMVHQHFMLIPNLTVAENVILGCEPPSSIGKLKLESAAQKIKQIAEDFELPIDPYEKIENISVGQRQRVEIIKALYRGANILILDEPTAVLTPLEVKIFFKTLKNLRENQKTIIIITHKLDEVMQIADNVTVMRAGKKIGDVPIEEASIEKMAYMMVGREIHEINARKSETHGEEVVRIENLCVKNGKEEKLKNINLSIRGGKIIGIAGVSGNGQTELELVLSGLMKMTSGKYFFKNEEYQNVHPATNREKNIVHIPSDRENMGYVHGFSNADNLTLGYHAQNKFCQTSGLRKEKAIREYAQDLIHKYNVMPSKEDILTTNLSGGNKQKLVIAREFEQKPQFMIIAEPTRGVDIGAIEFIHEKIIELRDMGVAILLISAELHEIRALSDKAFIMYEGVFAGSFTRDDYDETRVGMMMTGKNPTEATPHN